MGVLRKENTDWVKKCMGPGLQLVEPDFRISTKAITTVQTSPNVHISGNSNGHISVLLDATVTWLGTLRVLCTLI